MKDNDKNNEKVLTLGGGGGECAKHFIGIITFIPYHNPEELELLFTLFYR